MSKHKALDMFGRSGNPTLSDATFADFENVDQKTMTLQGTVNKVGILLALVVLSAAYTWNVYFVTGSPGALMPIGSRRRRRCCGRNAQATPSKPHRTAPAATDSPRCSQASCGCNRLVCCCACRRLNGDGGDSTAVHWREARVRHADGGVPPTDGERAHHSQLPTAGASGGCLSRAETTALGW